MKLFGILLLFTFLFSSKSFITEGDIWFQTYKLNETKAAVNLFTRGRFGFTYLKFSSYKLQNFSVILFAQNNIVQILETSDTELIGKNRTVILISQEKIKSFGNAFNDIELTIAFPIEYLDNNTLLTVGKLLKI